MILTGIRKEGGHYCITYPSGFLGSVVRLRLIFIRRTNCHPNIAVRERENDTILCMPNEFRSIEEHLHKNVCLPIASANLAWVSEKVLASLARLLTRFSGCTERSNGTTQCSIVTPYPRPRTMTIQHAQQ